jgi:hypothetical protein
MPSPLANQYFAVLLDYRRYDSLHISVPIMRKLNGEEFS